MGYIQNQEHFGNCLKKAVRESRQPIDKQQLLTLGVYIKEAYEFKDEFAWAASQDPTLLEEENFWEWIRGKRNAGFAFPEEVDQVTTPEFHQTVDDLVNVPGVYSFWNRNETCLYIGVSCDLSSRILSSFTARFKHYANEVYLRTVLAKTASDAAVLEALMISVYKPVLNKTGKFEDGFTLDYKIPEFGAPVLCNRVGEKVHVRLSRDSWVTRLAHEELNTDELEKDLEERAITPQDR